MVISRLSVVTNFTEMVKEYLFSEEYYPVLDLVKPSVITELFYVVYVYNLMFNNIPFHSSFGNQEQANRKDPPQRTLHLSGLEFYRTDNGAGRERQRN